MKCLEKKNCLTLFVVWDYKSKFLVEILQCNNHNAEKYYNSFLVFWRNVIILAQWYSTPFLPVPEQRRPQAAPVYETYEAFFFFTISVKYYNWSLATSKGPQKVLESMVSTKVANFSIHSGWILLTDDFVKNYMGSCPEPQKYDFFI